MTNDHSKQAYDLLTKTQWSGIHTPAIAWEWEKDKDNALATFKGSEDAAQFVHGYLDFHGGFQGLDINLDEPLAQWGSVRSEFSDAQSAARNIHIPKDVKDDLVTVAIPLASLSVEGLQKLLQWEAGMSEKKHAVVASAPNASS